MPRPRSKRAKKSEQTFQEAFELGKQHGVELVNNSDGCYQIRTKVDVPYEGRDSKQWIYNLYPRRHGYTPRIYSDTTHRGPFLDVPEFWTLLDAVKAVIQAKVEFTKK